jgi:hypothetical protein
MHKPRNEQVYDVKNDEEASKHPQLLRDFMHLFKLRREREQKRLSTYNPVYTHICNIVANALGTAEHDFSKNK